VNQTLHAVRGRLLTYPADPRADPVYIPDGLVSIAGGKIAAMGRAEQILPSLPAGTKVEDVSGKLITAGFIDPHIHYVQTRVIASYGTQLVEWLNRYTFPAELAFADPELAAEEAAFFIDELLRNGTTTAAVYGSVHAASIDAFFAESARRNTCMIAGKVMMDRHAPAGLLDTAQRSYDESAALIARWHGQGRQFYAITPRFALTSSDAQLHAAGALARENPDVYVQTHLAENHAEIAAVRALFPQDASYTAVYARHGLLGPRTLLGHCLHLSEAEMNLLDTHRAVAVFCPSSNLFLGSGLFDLARFSARAMRVGLATDIGGGTSFSMLRTAAEAYKVLQLQGQSWPAHAAFRQITRGNAEILGLDHRIGALEPGRDADMVVLDSGATPAMRHRREAIGDDLQAELFLLMTLGDDRAIAATYVAGEKAVLF
jgi:guanine deaminase